MPLSLITCIQHWASDKMAQVCLCPLSQLAAGAAGQLEEELCDISLRIQKNGDEPEARSYILECAQRRTTLHMEPRGRAHHHLRLKPLVSEKGLTRFSPTKCFLLYPHLAHYIRWMGFRKWIKMGI